MGLVYQNHAYNYRFPLYEYPLYFNTMYMVIW
jgi:hypothetical protein